MSTNPAEDFLLQNQPLSHWVDALCGTDPPGRSAAAAVWRQLGQALRTAVPQLAEALKHDQAEVRLEAVHVLRDLGVQLQPIASTVRAALKEAALKDADATVRTEAAEALDKHLEPQAASQIPGLIEALKDPVPTVRFGAAAALADLGREARQATSGLLNAALWDQDLRVRTQAAVALWRVDRRDRIAVPILIEALASLDEYLRWIAADCLGDIGPEAKDAVAALQRAAGEPYRTPLIRQSLVLALERIDPLAAAAVRKAGSSTE